jgi:DNA-binding IscR family transcriptional regulator
MSNAFSEMDKDKAALRIIMLLFKRKIPNESKMRLRSVASVIGVNRSQFDRTMKNLQKHGLVEDRVESIKGKRGVTKYPRLTSLGLEVAEKIEQVYQILRDVNE